MRTIVAAALLCLVIALMLPLLFAGGGQAAPATAQAQESGDDVADAMNALPEDLRRRLGL